MSDTLPQLIAANWKMNGMPDWAERVEDMAERLASERGKVTSAECLICPPHALIDRLCQAASGTSIRVGGQDCAEFEAGAHTGETDAVLLAALGASYVILGHSERRAAGETSDQVRDKAMRAMSAGLRPIICVGESLNEREQGHAVDVVREQLRASIPDEGAYDIAYEPIWAIGTGRTAGPDDIDAMHTALQAELRPDNRVLYGGSVKPGNAAEILSLPSVGGALVGGASLEMDSFADIIRAAR